MESTLLGTIIAQVNYGRKAGMFRVLPSPWQSATKVVCEVSGESKHVDR